MTIKPLPLTGALISAASLAGVRPDRHCRRCRQTDCPLHLGAAPFETSKAVKAAKASRRLPVIR
jgi:hypothetical protein